LIQDPLPSGLIQDPLTHSCSIVHASLVYRIRSLGVTIPARLLSSREMAPLSDQAQHVEDETFHILLWQYCRTMIQNSIRQQNLMGRVAIPVGSTRPGVVRDWLRDPANIPVLNGVTKLKFINFPIKSLPMEMRSFGGLQKFEIRQTQLCFLSHKPF
jgi:hypothetical protein